MTEHFLKVSYPQPDCRPKYQCDCGATVRTRLRHMEHVAAIRLGEMTPYSERIGVASENLRRASARLRQQVAAMDVNYLPTENGANVRWSWIDAAGWTVTTSDRRMAEARRRTPEEIWSLRA